MKLAKNEMISLGIVSLYTNLPVKEAIQVYADIVFGDYEQQPEPTTTTSQTDSQGKSLN